MQFSLRAPLGGALFFAGCLLAATGTLAQERFSVFVPTEQPVVDRMVKLANIRDGDVMVDLGSGDGRIVLAAVRASPKVRGWGVDIDEELVKKSNATAKQMGLADRVQFFHRNVFDTDVSNVTVIKIWLFPELMRLLRPKILAEARPGTRVVSHMFDFGTWQADETDIDGGSTVSMWIVPARLEGYWNWELPIGGSTHSYAAVLEQRFQVVEGIVRAGNRRGIFENVKLRGEDIAFTLEMTVEGTGLVNHAFTGKVRGDRIEGTVRVRPPKGEPFVLPWNATRSQNTAYYRPTGLEAR